MIIGLCGKADAGKDTVGGILYQSSSPIVGTRQLVAFAEPIKKYVNAIFGWDDRHAYGDLKEVVDPYWGFSPRYAYQTFGTEWARDLLRQDIWLRVAEKKLSASEVTIITDVRFPNEVEWVKDRGGILIQINRPKTKEVNSHSSETSMVDVEYDIVINNNGTLGDLSEQVTTKVSEFFNQNNI